MNRLPFTQSELNLINAPLTDSEPSSHAAICEAGQKGMEAGKAAASGADLFWGASVCAELDGFKAGTVAHKVYVCAYLLQLPPEGFALDTDGRIIQG